MSKQTGGEDYTVLAAPFVAVPHVVCNGPDNSRLH